MERDEDFVIFQLELGKEARELVDPGTARTEPRPKKKPQRAAAAHAEIKRTPITCKTPRYSYIVERLCLFISRTHRLDDDDRKACRT